MLMPGYYLRRIRLENGGAFSEGILVHEYFQDESAAARRKLIMDSTGGAGFV